MAKIAACIALLGIGMFAIPSIIQTPILILPFMAAILCVLFVSDNFIERGKFPPGPISLPVVGNWLQVGNDINHNMLIDLAKKYGNIFLLKLGSRNLVVVSDPKLATEVLHTQGVEFGSRPRNVVFDIFTGNGQDMVFTVYGDHWRKMRRIMTLPFFTNKVVQQYREMWEREMDLVVGDLNAKTEYATRAATEGVVIRRRLQLMLYNVMYGMMFHTRFDSVDDPKFKQASKFNSERSRLAQSFEYNYGDFIPVLRPFLRGYLNKCKDLQTRRLAFFNNQYVQKRRDILNGSGGGRKDGSKTELSCAMDHILAAEKSGEISSANVLYIVENINVAAIETTLWSMEWAIAELVNHPEIQTKLRKEIRDVLGGETPLTESCLQKLPYLQAVVKETLRLHSPIPLLVPHMNLEEGKLGGYTIPKESKVIVNSWWLANNPKWWDNPKEFRPERFMEEENEIEASAVGKGADFRYLPFGVGRRSCPGIILALPLLGLIVGKMVSNFEMVPPPGMDKVDVSEKPGQFSLHLAQHSTVVFRQIRNN